jgi:hypothetical protein
MENNKVVAEGKFEGSKIYFRGNKKIKKREGNYFLKICKKIKKKSDK